ncbi:unnamed protein product [Musa acuminata var. zebrina]
MRKSKMRITILEIDGLFLSGIHSMYIKTQHTPLLPRSSSPSHLLYGVTCTLHSCLEPWPIVSSVPLLSSVLIFVYGRVDLGLPLPLSVDSKGTE